MTDAKQMLDSHDEFCPCPHCGDPLLLSEDRGLHCDGCDDLTAEDEQAIIERFVATEQRDMPQGG